MPADFEKCQAAGGRMWTQDLGDGRYQHMCTLGGETHAGEVKQKKAEASMNGNEQVVQATAAAKFTGFTLTVDANGKADIKMNGKDIKDLDCVSVSVWPNSTWCPVELRWTTREKGVNAGEIGSSTSYYLRCPEPKLATAGNVRAEASLAEVEVAKNPAVFSDHLISPDARHKRQDIYKSL